MNLIAAIAEGHADWADILFLVAVIVFLVVAVIDAVARSVTSTLLAVGLAAVALGWLLL